MYGIPRRLLSTGTSRRDSEEFTDFFTKESYLRFRKDVLTLRILLSQKRRLRLDILGNIDPAAINHFRNVGSSK